MKLLNIFKISKCGKSKLNVTKDIKQFMLGFFTFGAPYLLQLFPDQLSPLYLGDITIWGRTNPLFSHTSVFGVAILTFLVLMSLMSNRGSHVEHRDTHW